MEAAQLTRINADPAGRRAAGPAVLVGAPQARRAALSRAAITAPRAARTLAVGVNSAAVLDKPPAQPANSGSPNGGEKTKVAINGQLLPMLLQPTGCSLHPTHTAACSLF